MGNALQSYARRAWAGLLRKEQSISTGLFIGLLIWTVTRLVDGITGSGTIEYHTAYSETTLASGRPATKIDVTLTNLSTDTAVSNLQASISDPDPRTVFSVAPNDSRCAYEPPAWVDTDKAVCAAHTAGMAFTAPMLVPGTSVRFGIKFTQASDAVDWPIVRIKPDGAAKFQLIEPGLQTFVTRHEPALLVALLAIALLLITISAASSVPKTDA
jgi:hypothetical protein